MDFSDFGIYFFSFCLFFVVLFFIVLMVRQCWCVDKS